MKKSLIKILFFTLLTAVSYVSASQDLKEFRKDSTVFIEQFEQFVQKNISEEYEDSLKSFVAKWNTNYFSEDTKGKFIDICNLLLDNKASRNPYFTRYFDLVMSFHRSEKAMKHYQNWEKGVLLILEQNKTPLRILMQYLRNTKSLIEDKHLVKSYSTNWAISTNDYKFIVDKTIKIEFNTADLVCNIKKDSIKIYNTKGVFYPTENQWVGKKGYVTWESAGYHVDSVRAELNNYKINLSKSGYSADSALFINKHYFSEPVLGKLTDLVVHVMSPQQAVYPVFNSYQKRFRIDNIYESINYDGGFSMNGANLLGSGDSENEAFLFIEKDNKTIITAMANKFMFRKKRVVSNNAQITIHLDNDSIFHPGILFTYITDKREISLTPSDRIVSKSPFFNSYHKISMNIDRLLWQIDSSKIFLTKPRSAAIGNAIYTSSNFYNLVEFDRVMMRDEFHPLLSLRHYSKQVQSETFRGEDLAIFLKYDAVMIKQMLMFLSVDGFIFYDTEKDMVTLKKKLYDFIEARFGKIDYDVIKFYSVAEGSNHNGVFDLNTFDLEINGVPQIFLSDSQGVAIYPKHQKIVMKKNRNFDFAGIIKAGLFTFYGQDFDFDYDTFKVNLHNIDSLIIKVPTEEYDLYNNPVLAHIRNTIKVITGELLIDNKDNKSGLKNYPEYPIFKSNENSYVYYDAKSIFNGVYTRDNFYFELDPFVIDSLDNFSVDGLYFEGKFYSSNIFPQFNDAIYMRPDYSLGFRRDTPNEGFPLYEGKGTYYQTIDMSNRGLKGSGILEYLTTKVQTDSVIFFPDSTNIHASSFTLAQRTSGIEFPELSSTEIDIMWYPYNDIMLAEQTNDPFNMYGNNSLFSGSLTIQPTGLVGSGTMDLEKAELKSKLINFEANAFTADTTSFSLKSLNKSDFNFITDNLKGRVDFSAQKANFTSNESFTLAKFPKNLYISYLDNFDWNIAFDEISIESSPQIDTTASPEVKELARLKDENLPGALYMSIHRGQDSLRFASTKATYKLRDSTINATEVEYIRVADAHVFPDKNDITIGHTAEIKTLINSEIIADHSTKFHKIYNAKVNIKGRYNYLGTGDYDYIDENKKVQNIHFTEIAVDENIQTSARGKIIADDNFTLSPAYNYRGDVVLNANEKFLTFKGGVKLEHQCPRKETHYAYFESKINPDSIYIPISNDLKGINGRGLFAASFITKDSSHIYTRFLDRRRDPNDVALVRATGYLHYNKNAKKYLIAQKPKLDKPDTIGSLVSLQTDFCLQHAEGKVDLGIDLGQVKFSAAGSLNHLLDKNEIKLELILPLDFFFSEKALDTLATELQYAASLSPMSISSKFFENNMNELVGNANYREFNNQIMLYANEAKLPRPAQHTILIGNIKMQWHTELGSYLNYGKIGISTINNRPINKYVDGYLQILKRRSGDLMKLYLMLPNGDYYYFTYSRGVMQALSNNTDFVDAIKNIKKRKRKLKTPRRQTPYRYIIATEQNRAQFVRSMRLFEEEQATREEERKRLEQEQKELEEIDKKLDQKTENPEKINETDQEIKENESLEEKKTEEKKEKIK